MYFFRAPATLTVGARGPASIHHLDTTGAKAPLVTGEKQHQMRYFLRVSIALKRSGYFSPSAPNLCDLPMPRGFIPR